MSSPRQRLVVCLDGTWNKRDDRTNVSHHYDLVREGPVPRRPGTREQIYQRKYYDSGVGTGVLDRISGGGFGAGLDDNVREAYDWLAANFQEHPDGDHDEIFIFGFSRGAFTARSLVGFISRCGLLRRGAPLSINQLWSAYCVLGREREQRSSLKDRLFRAEQAPFRDINQLVSDPWEGARLRAGHLNATEQLIVRWSRRVKITYLGVYDTVGAMGVDALAIPTLRSRASMHHNMRPTTLVQRCRHALALDEHRSSFRHTPFVAYSGHGLARAHAGRRPRPNDEELRNYWAGVEADWRQRIEQRWFVGAHANIGGGYDDNVLADLPLRWVLAGACADNVGLACEELPGPPVQPPLPAPRDSFLEFARPFWALLFRAKRHYRRLAPPIEARGSRRDDFAATERPPGFSLITINETVDDSVWAHYATCPPPQLVEFAQRTRPPAAVALQTEKCAHPWMGVGARPYFITALFAAFTAFGAMATVRFFAPGLPDAGIWPGLAAGALILIATDWGESWMNFQLARHGPTPARQAFRDAIYWTRSILVLLSFLGALHLLGSGWITGWQLESTAEAALAAADQTRFSARPVDIPQPILNVRMAQAALAQFFAGWPAGVAASGGVMLLLLAGAAGGRRRGRDFLGAAAGGAAALLVAPAALAAGFYAAQLLQPVTFDWPLHLAAGTPEAATFAGTLLLLQLAFLYFVRALIWCGAPMERANLGPIAPLHFAFTPARARAAFARWRTALACPWRPEAARQMAPLIRETLARDAIGLVPVYVLVFLLGLGFAARQLGWEWLEFSFAWGGRSTLTLPLWVTWPLATALCDYLEDLVHATMLRLDEAAQADPAAPGLRRPWAWALTLLAGGATLAKFAGGVGAALLTIAAISAGTVTLVADRLDAGWRSIPVLLLSTGGVLFMLATVFGLVWFRWRVGRKVRALA